MIVPCGGDLRALSNRHKWYFVSVQSNQVFHKMCSKHCLFYNSQIFQFNCHLSVVVQIIRYCFSL